MNKFLRHISIFSLPFIIGVVALFIIPLDREFAYNFLENDCYNHGAWIYDRIHKNEDPVDIAFIGTSATIQAIYEEKIESVLDSVYLKKRNLTNLGYCRPGRNLHYVLLKDLLEMKGIETLILEVRDDEDRYSHPVFPNLARANDVIAPALLFNRDIFSDWFKAIGTRFEFHRKKILFQLPESYEPQPSDYGYGAGTRIAPAKELKDAYDRRNKEKPELKKVQRNFYMQFPGTYIKKIVSLCQENEIELIFLYLKAYGSPQDKPKALETYKQYADLWIPPEEIFENPGNWMDPDHLNIRGASELADWLAGKINGL